MNYCEQVVVKWNEDDSRTRRLCGEPATTKHGDKWYCELHGDDIAAGGENAALMPDCDFCMGAGCAECAD